MKSCIICKKEYEPTGRNQRICGAEPCRKVVIKKADMKYRKSSKRKAWLEQYRQKPEVKSAMAASQKKWRQTESYQVWKADYFARPDVMQAIRDGRGKRRRTDEHRAKARAYGKTPKGRIIFFNAQSRRRGAKGKIDHEAWAAKLASFDYRCAICRTDGDIHIDHIMPISRGGSNHIDNLQPLCPKCNYQKNDRTMTEFKRSHPYLFCPRAPKT